MTALIDQKREKLRALLVGATADEIFDILRSLLSSDDPETVLAAIDITREGRAASALLVPDLLALLISRLYVPCTSMRDVAGGHIAIARAAMDAIVTIGVAPAPGALRPFLGATEGFDLPEACYDQGCYIGDYATDTVVPAELAARLAARFAGRSAP